MLKRSNASRSHNVYIDIVLRLGEAEKLDSKEFARILDNASLRYRIKRITEDAEQCEITLDVAKFDLAIYERAKEGLQNRYQSLTISIIDNARVIT